MKRDMYTITCEIVVKGEKHAQTVAAMLEAVLKTELSDIRVNSVEVEQYVHECEHRWRDYSEYGGDFLRGEVCRDCGAVRADVEAE